MAQKFTNNGRSLLTAGITATDTSITIEAGKADSFPVANTGTSAVPTAGLDYFKAVLQDTSGNIEIIYVRTRASGIAIFSNVLRGQEGTTARVYVAGSVAGLRLTALDHESSARSGANADITSLAGLTTALSVAQGGTGATTAGAARSALGAAASGANTDITSITGNAATASTSAACSGNSATATTANALAAANNYQGASLGIGTPASGTAGEIRATNNVTSYYSDKRLKANLRPIENALSKVLKIGGYLYEQNPEAEKFGYKNYETQVGVIAQEIQAVQPEAVTLAPFDIDEDGISKSGENYLTVRYERLIPLLIEAIKELQAEVATLKARL